MLSAAQHIRGESATIFRADVPSDFGGSPGYSRVEAPRVGCDCTCQPLLMQAHPEAPGACGSSARVSIMIGPLTSRRDEQKSNSLVGWASTVTSSPRSKSWRQSDRASRRIHRRRGACARHRRHDLACLSRLKQRSRKASRINGVGLMRLPLFVGGELCAQPL